MEHHVVLLFHGKTELPVKLFWYLLHHLCVISCLCCSHFTISRVTRHHAKKPLKS